MGEFGEMDNYRWGNINMSGLPHNCRICDETLKHEKYDADKHAD